MLIELIHRLHVPVAVTLVSTVEKEYKFEMEQHSRLQSSSRTPAVTSVSTTPEEAAKDAASLKLYEDLTDLQIVSVKIVEGKQGKEITFNCLQTVGERSKLLDPLCTLSYRDRRCLEIVLPTD